MLNVSVFFVEEDLDSCSGGRNAFPFVAVYCCLLLTESFARKLANGLRIPGEFCIIVL
jgi:hypothetical protein